MVALATMPAHAQRADSGAQSLDTAALPARPKLDAGVDTNSAQANYTYGLSMVYDNPQESVRAFYWASRLDPSSGDAMYALWTAKLLAMSDQELTSYTSRGREKRTSKQLALDSLIFRAYAVNPFLFSSIDGALMRRMIKADIVTSFPQITPGLLSQMVAGRMRAAATEPWMAYTEGRFQDALDAYARRLEMLSNFGNEVPKKKPNAKEKRYAEMQKLGRSYAQVDIHAKRARIFYQLHEFDSASTEMTAAISILQSQDTSAAQLIYQSKAIFDQSLGMIYEHDRRFDLAREAYGRAMQEDISYYAAHSHIAELELEQGDTANAISEMELAVQLEPEDPALRYHYATVLVQAFRDADATQQLRKAIALDPYYGSPHLLLASIGDLENYKSDAIAEYQAFVALAARSDARLPNVRARLAKLTAGTASTQPK